MKLGDAKVSLFESRRARRQFKSSQGLYSAINHLAPTHHERKSRDVRFEP